MSARTDLVTLTEETLRSQNVEIREEVIASRLVALWMVLYASCIRLARAQVDHLAHGGMLH